MKASGRRRRHRRHKRNRGTAAQGLLFVLPLCVFAVVCVVILYQYAVKNCVKPSLEVEVGEKCPDVQQFLNWKVDSAYFVSEVNEITYLNKIGSYHVTIRVYGRDIDSTVYAVDKTPPEVVARIPELEIGTTAEPEAFIESVKDVTATTVRFREKPDFQQTGLIPVTLEVEDEAHNITVVETGMEIKDMTPPVIEGVADISIRAGETVSYKRGVTVTDNYDTDVKLEVDASAADTEKEGDYEIVYTAVDAAGNEARATAILHVTEVKATDPPEISEAYVNAVADARLEKITTPDMTLYEVAKAIYWWVHDNIAYSDGAPKEDWLHGAYQGLVEQKGDCYTYAATSKWLLTRAGIPNIDIERIRHGDSMHFWNLIDIGEGWHHFDACRRADHSTFFYLTDDEIMVYSNAHHGTHNYDRSLYPEIVGQAPLE